MDGANGSDSDETLGKDIPLTGRPDVWEDGEQRVAKRRQTTPKGVLRGGDASTLEVRRQASLRAPAGSLGASNPAARQKEPDCGTRAAWKPP